MQDTTTSEALRFLQTISDVKFHGYDEINDARKSHFHSRGKTLLKRLAHDLGYRDGEFVIRSNKGVVAVCGEVTLHTDDLYVQFSQSCVGNGKTDILFRQCNGRKDYCGGTNHFMPFDALRDYFKAVRTIHGIRSATLKHQDANITLTKGNKQ